MSFDVCFWQKGEPSMSPVELYEEACEGISENFEPSLLLSEFREHLTLRWPEIENALEPLAYDPDLEVQEDLSRFILITLPVKSVAVLPDIVEMALTFKLTGYDPQAEQVIGQD
ncbi:hypothetical protein [Streptomyces sp. NBC_00687]|uniref:hypothetical protein n=1 Tax=Streptomyces sp. NBC_00687 TaxID=2975807 RepID=UPI0022505639|nr:hypothetical protein [Streptomyces sp. NBC_00687]MCX4911991.1 hypothetical protein [Streptomyces sp. NBC_00687]